MFGISKVPQSCQESPKRLPRAPKWCPKGAQEGFKSAQETPKRRQRPAKRWAGVPQTLSKVYPADPKAKAWCNHARSGENPLPDRALTRSSWFFASSRAQRNVRSIQKKPWFLLCFIHPKPVRSASSFAPKGIEKTRLGGSKTCLLYTSPSPRDRG